MMCQVFIASKLKNVLWLGVNEDTLRYFGITHDNKQRVVPYYPDRAPITQSNLDKLLKEDNRFSSVIDKDFLIERYTSKQVKNVKSDRYVYVKTIKGQKVEIDAILAHTTPKELWKYLQGILDKKYPTRNYNGRVIDPLPDLYNQFPEPIRKLISFYDNRAGEITAEESKNVMAELDGYKGFLISNKERNNILERYGKIIKEDTKLNEIADKITKLDKEGKYGIGNTKPEHKGVIWEVDEEDD